MGMVSPHVKINLLANHAAQVLEMVAIGCNWLQSIYHIADSSKMVCH